MLTKHIFHTKTQEVPDLMVEYIEYLKLSLSKKTCYLYGLFLEFWESFILVQVIFHVILKHGCLIILAANVPCTLEEHCYSCRNGGSREQMLRAARKDRDRAPKDTGQRPPPDLKTSTPSSNSREELNITASKENLI